MFKQVSVLDLNLVKTETPNSTIADAGVSVRTETEPTYHGGENFNLRDMLLAGRKIGFADRMHLVHSWLEGGRAANEILQSREVTSSADREVRVFDPKLGHERSMLMFGANNYLGLASHPHVRQRVLEAIEEYGVGVGGPPLLNGFTRLHRQVQEALARIKGTEDALIFSSGYGANVGVASALIGPSDAVFYDTYSHASFCDGLKMTSAKSYPFAHNDVRDLVKQIELHSSDSSRMRARDIFIAIEGVYSMDGDIAPLDEIMNVARRYNATVILDDAHGLGVVGSRGHGTAEAFGLDGSVPITVGTFSKTLSVAGGFVAGSREVCDYLRYLSRPYMFSASVPPPILGAVLGGLEVLDREPQLMDRLHANVQYALTEFEAIGIRTSTQSAIIPIRVPQHVHIRKAAYALHEMGIFVNSIEYPAVPVREQRFRVSLMATHTKEDIDRLISAFSIIWEQYVVRPRSRQAKDCSSSQASIYA